ncbi:hypothetical protein C8J57DRAFT_1658435 [Mycena rebaudengoi]|nr:hypothetical protein C8J57DRAFT_1658435 [Mycena rebaudengoi]
MGADKLLVGLQTVAQVWRNTSVERVLQRRSWWTHSLWGRREKGVFSGVGAEVKHAGLTTYCAGEEALISDASAAERLAASHAVVQARKRCRQRRKKGGVSGRGAEEKLADSHPDAHEKGGVSGGVKRATSVAAAQRRSVADSHPDAQARKGRHQWPGHEGEAGGLTACCSGAKRAASAARAQRRSWRTHTLLRRRAKGGVSGRGAEEQLADSQADAQARSTKWAASAAGVQRRSGRTHALMHRREKRGVSGADAVKKVDGLTG